MTTVMPSRSPRAGSSHLVTVATATPSHRHLLAGVARDVEAEQGDERDDEAGHDHVEHNDEN